MGSRLQTALDTPYGQMTDEQKGLVKEASFLLSDEELAQYPFLAVTTEPSMPEPLQAPAEEEVVGGPDAYDPEKDPTTPEVEETTPEVEETTPSTPEEVPAPEEGDSLETV